MHRHAGIEIGVTPAWLSNTPENGKAFFDAIVKHPRKCNRWVPDPKKSYRAYFLSFFSKFVEMVDKRTDFFTDICGRYSDIKNGVDKSFKDSKKASLIYDKIKPLIQENDKA